VSDPARLREQAQHILAGRKFHGRRTPAPFRGVLHAIGRVLDKVFGPVGRFLAPVGRFVMRVWATAAGKLFIAALVLAGVVAMTLFLARRRSVSAVGRRGRGDGWSDEDAAALEREADRAEREGDFDAALRLRFRAGLTRLHQAGQVRLPRTVTTGGVARQLGSSTFDGLGRTFDAVAYGRRPATPDDVEAARANWPRVLQESRR
jgi:hypothetical protein